MYYILGKHNVEDFKKWKKVFDEDSPNRKSAGSTGGLIIHNADNPNTFYVLLQIKDEKSSKEFYRILTSDMMKEVYKKAGVIGMPEFEIYNDTQQVQF